MLLIRGVMSISSVVAYAKPPVRTKPRDKRDDFNCEAAPPSRRPPCSSSLSPSASTNTYRGYKFALWFFALVVVMKVAMSCIDHCTCSSRQGQRFQPGRAVRCAKVLRQNEISGGFLGRPRENRHAATRRHGARCSTAGEASKP